MLNMANLIRMLHLKREFPMVKISTAAVQPPDEYEHLHMPENPRASKEFKILVDKIVSLRPLSDVALAYCRYAFQRYGQNVTHTAEGLGVARRTIQRWFGESPVRLKIATGTLTNHIDNALDKDK